MLIASSAGAMALEPEERDHYLSTTDYIDYAQPNIAALVTALKRSNNVDTAVALHDFVRTPKNALMASTQLSAAYPALAAMVNITCN